MTMFKMGTVMHTLAAQSENKREQLETLSLLELRKIRAAVLASEEFELMNKYIRLIAIHLGRETGAAATYQGFCYEEGNLCVFYDPSDDHREVSFTGADRYIVTIYDNRNPEDPIFVPGNWVERLIEIGKEAELLEKKAQAERDEQERKKIINVMCYDFE